MPGFRLLHEARPGPDPAGNTGVNAATGDILAHIDADCRAHPDWRSNLLQALCSSRNAARFSEETSGNGGLNAITAYRRAEDIEWGQHGRAQYVPEMIVFQPARNSVQELYTKWDQYIVYYPTWQKARADGNCAGSCKWCSC